MEHADIVHDCHSKLDCSDSSLLDTSIVTLISSASSLVFFSRHVYIYLFSGLISRIDLHILRLVLLAASYVMRFRFVSVSSKEEERLHISFIIAVSRKCILT